MADSNELNSLDLNRRRTEHKPLDGTIILVADYRSLAGHTITPHLPFRRLRVSYANALPDASSADWYRQ